MVIKDIKAFRLSYHNQAVCNSEEYEYNHN